jgi:hypothetical protein
MCTGILVVLTILLCAGCAGTHVTVDEMAAARVAGMISVDVAVRTNVVNPIELSLLRPLFVDAEAVLAAEPATQPELWTTLVLARLDTLTGVTEAERLLMREAVLTLSTIRIEVDDEEYEANVAHASALTAAYLRGVIQGIDSLVPPGP